MLSLYLALFLGGLVLLLRRTETTWPLLLLAPMLAYNFAFTSGWLNFCYGVALGMYALVIYLRWQECSNNRDLLLLAAVLLLMYTAHLLTWLLMVVIMTAMMTVEPWQIRRQGLLLLAMMSALPLLLITRPFLGGATLLIGPILWVGALLLQRVRLGLRSLASGIVGVTGLFIGVTKISEPFYQNFIPELEYSEFDKFTFPLRLFSLPHQYLPPSLPLVIYNLILLGLTVSLGGLLVWCIWNRIEGDKTPWLAAFGSLGVLYFVIPSRTSDIWITEPRVLLFIVLLALVMVRLPASGRLRKSITICAAGICLLSISGTTVYAYTYNEQARAWKAQMDLLEPARSVLMLREKKNEYISRPTILGIFNRFYTGEYFSTIYTLEHGGFGSRTFNNGPVRPHPTIPIPAYDWSDFSDTNYVADHCSDLREAYDAVLLWGQPEAKVATQLDECFVAGPRWPTMAIWQHRAEP